MKLRSIIENGDPGNKEAAYKFFVEEKGYTPEVALGIVGNLMQESHDSLNTKALGFDGTGSFGIAQWLGPRKKKLKEIRPKDFDTLRGQLEFIDWELNNTEKRAAAKLKGASSVEDAALLFSKYYERPHKDYAHNDKRVSFAQKLGKDLGVFTDNKQPEKLPKDIKEENKLREVISDNTAVKPKKIPNLATPLLYPNYTQLPELPEQKQEVEETNINEQQVRQLLAQEREAIESRFLSAFQQQNATEEPDYTPQPQEGDLSHLYNYIDIETYADGGEYTVRSGDSLSKIAKKNNMSLSQILEINQGYKENNI